MHASAISFERGAPVIVSHKAAVSIPAAPLQRSLPVPESANVVSDQSSVQPVVTGGSLEDVVTRVTGGGRIPRILVAHDGGIVTGATADDVRRPCGRDRDRRRRHAAMW